MSSLGQALKLLDILLAAWSRFAVVIAEAKRLRDLAREEGRPISDEELDMFRERTQSAIDKLLDE